MTTNGTVPAVVAAKIPELRAKYGPNLLYVDLVGGLVCSVVTRGSLLRFEADCAIDPIWARIQLFRAHLLYPQDWGRLSEQLSIQNAMAAADAVIQASGFYSGDLDKEVLDMRCQVLERDHAIIRHICRAFTAINPLDINKLPKSDIIYLLAQAEMALGITYDGNVLDEHAMNVLMAIKMAKTSKGPRAKTFDVEHDQQEAVAFDSSDISDGDRYIRARQKIQRARRRGMGS